MLLSSNSPGYCHLIHHAIIIYFTRLLSSNSPGYCHLIHEAIAI